MDYENSFTKEINYPELLTLSEKEYDSFSLVWRPDFEFNNNAIEFEDHLKPFLLKTEESSEWPGTTVYGPPSKINYYKVTKQSLGVLAKAKSIIELVSPSYPEDLAFYKKGKVKFASVSHEGMAWHEKT